MSDSFTTYFHRNIDEDMRSVRGVKKTKIVATVGPSSEDAKTIKGMYRNGMNVARFNMSHGDHADHDRRLELVRRLSLEMQRPIAVLVDLQGPKIRTGRLKDNEPVMLEAGKTICITTEDYPQGNAERVGTTYPELHKDVEKDSTILINDGKLRLKVLSVQNRDINCEIIVGGELSNNKGINLPDASITAPPLSDKDKDDLDWALRNNVDYIALSFVRDAQDIQNLKRRILEVGKRIPVIAKIERPEAVNNIESILRVTDGIMVARGDLGIEINTERLPVVQKHLIYRANAHGRLVITATQMLESMIDNPIPTRAETSDVANAIFDGTDAVMLSGETASGSYPVEAVAEMKRIAIEAETSPFVPQTKADRELSHFSDMDYSMTSSAQYLASELDARAVMIFSHGSEKAHLISKLRSNFPYLCVCYSESTWRRMSLYWGVVPLWVEFFEDQNDLLEAGIQDAIRHKLIDPKVQEDIVVLMGYGATGGNSLKVVQA